jgi:hypothetical protein
VNKKEPSVGGLAICAIFKNEGPYVLEWLAHHIAVGVDEFFIADNESSDGSSVLLRHLAELGIIRYVYFPTPQGEAPQLAAYRKLMELYGRGPAWVAFIDADEFLMPLNRKTIKEVVQEVSQLEPSVGALAISWANYGSAGEQGYRPELVMERFIQRAGKDFSVNHHYKSIVKSEAFKTTHGNPHLFELNPGYIYVHPDGRELRDRVKGVKGISDNVCWENIRLNHYIVKSYGEFLLKKGRGRATVKGNAGLERNIEFFHAHDTNDERECPPKNLVSQVQRIIKDVKDRLASHGTPAEVITIVPQVDSKIMAVIDSCRRIDDKLVIVGWAFSSDLANVAFSVLTKDNRYSVDCIEAIDRPDVGRQVHGAPHLCGFRIAFDTNIMHDLQDELLHLELATSTQSVTLPLVDANRPAHSKDES